MATYYKFLDERSKNAKKYPLKIAISHKKKTRYISTGYYLAKKEWNSAKEKVQPPYKNSGSANSKINRKYAIIGEVLDSLRPYWKELNVDQIKEAAEEKINEEFQQKVIDSTPQILNVALNSERADYTCFYECAKTIIKQYYKDDKGGSARIMEGTTKSLKYFSHKENLPFRNIDLEFLKSYEAWYVKQFNLKGERNNVNGLGFKMRAIRCIYNLAIKDKTIEDVVPDMYPFGRQGYSIKREKTDNKNVDPSEIAKIFDLKLTPETKLWHHLNFFKYYFECWGMNYADVAHLRVYQVQKGRLKYRRRKTRWSNNAKKFDIVHSPIAQEIIDYYTKNKKLNDFVFPIIGDIFSLNSELANKEQEIANKKLFEKKFVHRRSNHIRRLKTISKQAGLKENVSIYVGRHSFFSIALRNGVSKSEISELAGHSNFQVTEAYLDGFSGEQLATSANLVRNVIASYTEVVGSNNILNKKLNLKTTGKEIKVLDFLLMISNNKENSDQTNLLIEILQKTDCNDGIKAQEYVNCFLDGLTGIQAKAS